MIIIEDVLHIVQWKSAMVCQVEYVIQSDSVSNTSGFTAMCWTLQMWSCTVS